MTFGGNRSEHRILGGGRVAVRPAEDGKVSLLKVQQLDPGAYGETPVAPRSRMAVREVDQDSRLVDLWTPGDLRPEVLRDVLEWQPKAGIPLRIVLPESFSTDAD
jgi:hypothetical protein